MRISDWSSDVCSSDLIPPRSAEPHATSATAVDDALALPDYLVKHYWWAYLWRPAVWFFDHQPIINTIVFGQYRKLTENTVRLLRPQQRSEEHTSELQSLMRISYADFCLTK